VVVELLRIDDRLVHGQVVEGWLKALHINHVVVASDAVDADETQKALYFLAVPLGIQLTCLSVREAAKAWRANRWREDKVLMLVSTPEDVLKLAEAGAPVRSVNVGGLHFQEGRIQVLKGISLDDSAVRVLKALSAQGIVLEARALPLDDPLDIVLFLQQWAAQKELLGDQPR
jgi:mannose/fructose/N-acetylgalactosamine-specific phosphotransferase system component IIB